MTNQLFINYSPFVVPPDDDYWYLQFWIPHVYYTLTPRDNLWPEIDSEKIEDLLQSTSPWIY